MKNEVQGTSLVKGYKRHRSGGVEVECCERIITHVMELSGWSPLTFEMQAEGIVIPAVLVWRRDRISGSSVVP